MRAKMSREDRKCLHCGQMYSPDPRTRDRQQHCSLPACKKASKAWRQRRWLSKPQNQDYFRGPTNVQRTQQWREAHPCYWRRCSKRRNALQDDCDAQPSETRPDKATTLEGALQDDCRTQAALFTGLIAHVTGSTLQDDIAFAVRRIHTYGQTILGMVSGMEQGGYGNGSQTRTSARASAKGPETL